MSDPANISIAIRPICLVCLVAVWFVAAIGLYHFWPISPRFTFEVKGRVQFVGVTEDSRTLVGLERQLIESVDQEGFTTESDRPHSLRVWNLSTGKARAIALTSQLKSARHGTPQETARETTAQNGLEVIFPGEPIIGHVCRLIEQNGHGERWAVTIDLDGGTLQRVRLPNRQHPVGSTRMRLSTNGRWIADIGGFDEKNEQAETVLKIIDCTTGKMTAEFSGTNPPDICFSDDESLLAVVESQPDDEYATTIWQLDPLEHLCVIPSNLPTMAFSPSNAWIAGWDDQRIELIDPRAGRTVLTIQPQSSLPGETDFSPRKFRFSSDEKTLFGYDYLRGGASGIAGPHCYVSEVRVWDLTSGQAKTAYTSSNDYLFDPNLCEDGSGNQTTPEVLRDNNRVFDLSSGKTLLTFPEDSQIEFFDGEKGVAILQQDHIRRFNRLLTRLSKWKIPIPNFLWQDDEGSELLVCETPSGRVRKTLPFDRYQVSKDAMIMAPNRETLVTLSRSSKGDFSKIRVWYLDAWDSLPVAMAWSFLAPLSGGLLLLLWNSRTRRRH